MAARLHFVAGIVFPFAVGLLGCPEYLDEGGPEFDISFHSTFHHGAWGGDAVDCRVELAFLQPGEWDGLDGGEGAVTEHPVEAGSCEISWFDRDTEQAHGSLSLAGSLEAGESLWIGDEEQSLSLVRDDIGSDSFLYTLPDCDGSSFPFAQVLDLTVSGSESSIDVPGFSLEDALGVGQDMVLLEPTGSAALAGMLELVQHEDLRLVWEYEGEHPSLGEAALEPDPIIYLRNQEPDGFLFEAVACRPEVDGEFTIPAEILQQLTPQPPDDPDYYLSSLQLDAIYSGGEYETPWGSIQRRRTRISDGGLVRILASP